MKAKSLYIYLALIVIILVLGLAGARNIGTKAAARPPGSITVKSGCVKHIPATTNHYASKKSAAGSFYP